MMIMIVIVIIIIPHDISSTAVIIALPAVIVALPVVFVVVVAVVSGQNPPQRLFLAAEYIPGVT